jgi:flagellar biogenesis protein FliO
MNTQHHYHFLYKILIAVVLIIFGQNIHICPAENPSDVNFDQSNYRKNYGQNQYNRQQNNQPENSNLPKVNFGKNLNSDSIQEPLPLPIPPKPAVNRKNDQLNALKNGINNSSKPIHSPHVFTSETTLANYTTNKTTANPIKLASAETTNPHNISPNTTQNNQHDNSETLPKFEPAVTNTTINSPTFETSETSSDALPNNYNEINVTKKNHGQNSDIILDQKIDMGNDNKNTKLKKPQISQIFGPVISVVASLLIVISVFLILMVLFRKISPNAVQSLPKEVFENLGKTFLSQKLQVHLLRLGNRLILVSATNDTLTPITEITDPDEVVTVLGMCRQLNNNGINKFHQNLSSQLNSTNNSRNNNFSKDHTTKNNSNDYFGINQTDQDEIRNYKHQHSRGIDIYSDPDNSLAAILASGIERKGVK